VPVKLYLDVHAPRAIAHQLRRRGVDVLTAQEDGHDNVPDEVLLARATVIERLVFTQDIRFKFLAEQWQADSKAFAGLAFGHQLRGTIGMYVEDLTLIAQASDPSEWLNQVVYLPFHRP
jgi:hypothetical protein